MVKQCLVKHILIHFLFTSLIRVIAIEYEVPVQKGPTSHMFDLIIIYTLQMTKLKQAHWNKPGKGLQNISFHSSSYLLGQHV